MIQLSTLPEGCNSYYANNYITGLSVEAFNEKKANFSEVHGYAIGFATVNHPDWHEALKFASETGHIWAVCVDGRRHIGLIYNSRTSQGKIELSS